MLSVAVQSLPSTRRAANLVAIATAFLGCGTTAPPCSDCPDLEPASDLASLMDLSTGPDLGEPPDLATAPDLAPSRWAVQPSGTKLGLSSIWGSAAHDIFVAGGGQNTTVLLHSADGKTWQDVNTVAPNLGIAVSGDGLGDVWLVGTALQHSTDGGKTWKQEQGLNPGDWTCCVTTQGRAAFAITQQHFILYSQGEGGGAWTSFPHGMDVNGPIWTSDGARLYVGSAGGTIYASDDNGKTLSIVRAEDAAEQHWYGYWGSGASLIYAVGAQFFPNSNPVRADGLVIHSNDAGKTWTKATFPSKDPMDPEVTLLGVSGSGPNDVWVVGNPPMILHSTDGGKSWQQNQPPIPPGVMALLAVWAEIPGDVYVVGEPGIILHLE
jgi:photosystem II stability/assembly factor-like uncharacterized protein